MFDPIVYKEKAEALDRYLQTLKEKSNEDLIALLRGEINQIAYHGVGQEVAFLLEEIKRRLEEKK